jgi:hypothetical protein
MCHCWSFLTTQQKPCVGGFDGGGAGGAWLSRAPWLDGRACNCRASSLAIRRAYGSCWSAGLPASRWARVTRLGACCWDSWLDASTPAWEFFACGYECMG